MQRLSTLVILVGFISSSGCATVFGGTVGVNVLATPRGHTMVAAGANLHAVVGKLSSPSATTAWMMGPELNLRATDDYGHFGFGFTGSVLTSPAGWAGYARIGLAPLSGSVRNATVSHSMNTSLELGFLAITGRPAADPGARVDNAQGVLFTLRTDLDYQTSLANVDLFFSLNIGYGAYSFNRAP